jgi:hypothetical protein
MPGHGMKQGVGSPPPRLRWRAIIHAAQKQEPGRGGGALAWHMVECTDPSNPEAHCEVVGRGLMALDGNPDGHCEINGVCLRCEQAAAEPPPAEPAAAPAPEPPQPEAAPAEPRPAAEPEPTPPQG